MTDEEYTCKECGVVVPVRVGSGWEGLDRDLREAGQCYRCNFWMIRVVAPHEFIVMDNVCYKLGSPALCAWPGFMLGFGGQRWKLRNLQTNEVIETNNLWCNGTIPQHFRDRLPNTYEEVSDNA